MQDGKWITVGGRKLFIAKEKTSVNKKDRKSKTKSGKNAKGVRTGGLRSATTGRAKGTAKVKSGSTGRGVAQGGTRSGKSGVRKRK